MVEIMEHIHNYVPSKQYCDYDENDETISIPRAILYPILFGGDQVTATRARSAKLAKVNSYDPCKRFDGIIPIAADWHTKLNLLGV